MLLSEDFQGCVLKSFSDKDARILVVTIQLHDGVIHVISTYAPNIEQKE